ncbi:MAG: Na+/H+ antiporter subunit E [Ignavibacteriaceae bacterium]
MNLVKTKVTILHAVLLMIFWLLLSGFFDLFHISLGVFSVILVLVINRKIRQHNYFDEMLPGVKHIRFLRLLYFIPWLLWEIVLSSFRIAFLIIHPKMPIKAGLIKFKTNLPHMNAKVFLGNAITLTPGTVTLEIKGNDFLVHAMTNQATEEHIDHSLTVEVAKLYYLDPGKVVYDEIVITSMEEI